MRTTLAPSGVAITSRMPLRRAERSAIRRATVSDSRRSCDEAATLGMLGGARIAGAGAATTGAAATAGAWIV
jgi:hypothetical protein